MYIRIDNRFGNLEDCERCFKVGVRFVRDRSFEADDGCMFKPALPLRLGLSPILRCRSRMSKRAFSEGSLLSKS